VFFNVSQLLREETGATRTFTIDETVTLPVEGSPAGRVTGSVRLTRTDRGLLAQGTLEVVASEPCSRCLKPAAVPLELEIEDEYFPTVDPFTSFRLPELDEPTPFRIDEQHHLDLSEAVRQAVVVAEPMAPLCRPDCRGLCVDCGVDLNEVQGAHACATGPVDDRWAALRRFQES
jgi:uncharacterized protein